MKRKGKLNTIDLIAEDFSPEPIAHLESNRSLGYSVAEAVADLVDNSITARANEIYLFFNWNNGTPEFKLRDNGFGMNKTELINSFRLGSTIERAEDDLGRFGFGMKTASLSQARELVVISKTIESDVNLRSLDLDFIANKNTKWNLKHCSETDFKSDIEALLNINSGTILVWKNWDRAPQTKDDFVDVIVGVSDYLSICFHRFIENGLKIMIHDQLLKPVSPIPVESQKFSEISLSKNSKSKQVGYILRHPKFWELDYDNSVHLNSYKLFNGFQSQQGIYIYRCNRLLNPFGGWLGLVKPTNSSKLARVIIDYPNSADKLWSLDITKTNASVPYVFRKEIEKLIERTKLESASKITRGTKSIAKRVRNLHDNSLVWVAKEDPAMKCYRYFPDIEHPIFASLINEGKIEKKNLEFLLDILSQNLPIAQIIENNDGNSGNHDRISKRDTLTRQEIEIAREIFERVKIKKNKMEAINFLLRCEPYCYYEDQILKIFND
jgi:hypothetical protein